MNAMPSDVFCPFMSMPCLQTVAASFDVEEFTVLQWFDASRAVAKKGVSILPSADWYCAVVQVVAMKPHEWHWLTSGVGKVLLNHVHSVMVKDFNFTWRAAVGLD